MSSKGGTNGAEADSFENAGAAITAITQPAVGAAVLNADGSITYTPPADYNGTVTLSYTVTSGGVSETATITIEVTAVNDAPVNTVPGAQTLGEDAGPVAIPGLSVADPDSSDAAPQVLTTVLTIPAASGALAAAGGTYNAATGELTISGTAAQINAALATLTYTPTADFNTGAAGPFTVTMVSDDGVAAPAVSSFTIAVTPVADIVADTVTTAEDSAVTFNPLSGANGAEADSFENSGAAITAITQPAVGAAVLNADGSITYTPPADYNGTVTLSYTVTSGGVSETATITIEVTSVNDAPVNTVPGAQTLGEDAGPVAIPGLSVADPDSSDAAPQVLTTVLTIPAASGALAAAGGTYNAATGELTISGTAARSMPRLRR